MKKTIQALVAALILGAATPALSDQMSTINGQEVRIATLYLSLEQGDRQAFDRAALALSRAVPISATPLDYSTLAEIPDARTVGIGDCKTLSVAFRNILVDTMGFDRESLLLATAKLPSGALHMVLLINVVDNGKQRTLAYDSIKHAVVPISELTQEGYQWIGRESYPDANTRLLRFNGTNIY